MVAGQSPTKTAASSPLVRVGLGLALVAGAVLIGRYGVERGPFDEDPPSWSAGYWFRTIMLAAAAYLVVSALMLWNGERRQRGGVQFLPLARLAVLAIPAGALACVSLLAIGPRYFTRLALEDRPVEYFSFLLLLAACGLILGAVRFVFKSTTDSRALLALPIALAFVFFLIAMEEVSWFQRVLNVDTPDALASNAQGELNLHNFATTPAENGYYFGGFVALMLVPLVLQAFDIRLPGSLGLFKPAAVTALAAAPAFAFNFDMWDIALMQLSFYGALAVVLLWIAQELEPADRWIAYYVAGATAVVQLVMITLGHRSDLIWDATEYKEMFIPAGFAVYAYNVFERCRALRATAAPANSTSHNVRA